MCGSITADCDAQTKDATTVDAKLQHKRTYNRERLRHKTLAYKTDVRALTEEIDRLQSQLAAMIFGRTRTLLSWKDVADVFLSDLSMAEHQRASLGKQVAAQDKLKRALLQWLTAVQTSVHRSPNPTAFTYKYTSLVADAAARSLGLDWISKRLYHNLNPWLERSRVAVSADPYYRVDVRQAEDLSHYILEEYKQRVEPMALPQVSSILHRMYFELVDGDQVDEDQGRELRYLRYASLYGQARNHSFHEKMLVRAFDDPARSRYVIFTHSISDDSKYPDDIQSDWTAWVVAEALSPTETVIQHGYISNGLRRASGHFTLEEECPALAGCTFPSDDDKFDKFAQLQRTYRSSRQAGDIAHFTRVADEVARGS